MAGETRGELAEAIAKAAIEEALRRRRTRTNVYWEETPDDAVIKPDITTGPSKDRPTNVVLVNASDTARNSEIKFWRNVGEIFDCKTRLTPAPTVLALFFRSEIKPELIKLIAAIADRTHLVDRDPVHGAAITSWLEANHASAPSAKDGKESLVRTALASTRAGGPSAFAQSIEHLASVLCEQLFAPRAELGSLWDLARADYRNRTRGPFREARTTLLRRGLARWAVFDAASCKAVMDAHFRGRAVLRAETPSYATSLGLLKSSINGSVIPGNDGNAQDMVATVGHDLRMAAQFFKEASHGDAGAARNALESALEAVPGEMRRVAEQLRAVPSRVESWHGYVLAHWGRLCSADGLLSALVRCRETPGMGGRLPASEGLWLYDHLIAVLRANSGRNNDFGYGALVSHFKAARSSREFIRFMNDLVRALPAPEATFARGWLESTLPHSAEPGRRGFQDWLAGKKPVAKVIIGAFAYALAAKLTDIPRPTRLAPEELVAAHAYSLWNKLLTYQDFEPLPALVLAACPGRARRVSARTVMADLAERAVQDAGSMPALAFDGGLVCWKSVTDAGKDHKRKELCGRARALRFEYARSRFSARESARKLLLVIDGTFNSKDVAVLMESGWDSVFYPDEMDRLTEAMG